MRGITAELSAGEARDLALRAQGLVGAPPGGRRDARVSAVLRQLGAIQLDTMNTLLAARTSLRRDAVRPMARALVGAAEWVGCTAVAVDAVAPADLKNPRQA